MQRSPSLLRFALCAAAVVTLSACPDPEPSPDGGKPDAGAPEDGGAPDGGSPDGGSPDGGSPDGGSPDGGAPDGGSPDGGDDAGPPPGPSIGELEHLGLFLPSAPSAILPSDTADRVVFGYRGLPIDPTLFDLEGDPGSEYLIRTGLVVLDRATGKTRLYDEHDGVPAYEYMDIAGPLDTAAAPVIDLAWIEDGVRFAGSLWTHLLVGTFAGDELTFTSVTLRAPGATEDAFVGTVAVHDGRLYVATSQGVAVVDPDTLAVLSWPDLGLGVAHPYTYWIRAGTLSEPVLAVSAGITDDGVPTHVVILRPGDGSSAPVVETLALAEGEQALWLLPLDGQVLLSVMSAVGGEIRSVVDGVSGPVASLWASADDLSAATGEAVMPYRLALDAGRQRVLVGGRILDGSGRGRGLVQIPLTVEGAAAGPAARLIDRRDPYSDMLPWQLDALAVDRDGDLYMAGRQLCNDVHMRQLTPLRLEERDGELRLVRPWLSGVRAISVDPIDGHTWIGTRDENPGAACAGPALQQGVCRLRADGACELYTPVPNSGDSAILPNPGTVEIAFGDPGRREMAIATTREALYLRAGDVSVVRMTQLDPGLNLHMTSAAFGEPGELWLGSEMHYGLYPQPDLDEEAINLRGPHGLGFLELDENARVSTSRRYVREVSDLPNRDEVGGLPSDWIWDVLPLEGSRKALVATGWERRARAYDHILPETSPRQIRGGLAIIDDRMVTQVTSAKQFGDVVALARGADGTLWGLDADEGVFVIDLDNATAEQRFSASWSAPERGVSLAVDDSGRVAVGTTEGLYLFGPDGGRTDVLAAGEAGFVWALRFVSNGVLYAGTDEGLYRFALTGATLPPRGPEGTLSREIWGLSWGCYGEQGCTCGWDNDCAPGLSCTCAGGSCTCEDPGARDDAGVRDDAGAGGDAGVRDDGGTASDAGTSDGGAGDCNLDCSCATQSGCPDGFTCQGGFAGFSCVEDPPPPPVCANDCTCATTSGCPDGYYCQSGFAGDSCLPNP